MFPQRRKTIKTSPSTAEPPRRRQTIKTSPSTAGRSASAVSGGWLEVEDIDPDTGELLGTHLQRLDADGQPTGEPINPTTPPMPTIGPGVGPRVTPRLIKRPRTIRIGVIVPLASLLDASDAPGELADRSGFIPGDILKDQIATR